MIYTILYTIIGLSAFTILAVIIKNYKKIVSIDVDSIPQEQQRAVKDKILQGRFKNSFNKVMKGGQGAARKTQGKLKEFYEKVQEMEKRYRKPLPPKNKKDVEDIQLKVQKMLSEAKQLFDKEEFSQAEKKYIEIISWDAKNLEAYEGLGDVYMEMKEYAQAKETLEYLVRLAETSEGSFQRLGVKANEDSDLEAAEEDSLQSMKKNVNIAEYRFSLSEVYESMGSMDKAYENIEKAVTQAKNNPRYLDRIVGLSIDMGKRDEAKNWLKQLREVNPDNKKVEEYESKIKEMRYKV